MRLAEGTGGARDVAVCRKSYSAFARARSKSYAGRFKDGYETKSLDLKQLAREVCRSVYSSSLFDDGVRLNANFITSLYCVLDIDFIDYTLDQAVRDWADTVCIIGTTGTHQRPKANPDVSRIAEMPIEVTCDRFRIIAPWERPIESAYEYRKNLEFMVDKYGGDKSCIDPARLWFPCSKIVYLNEDGYLQPVKSFAPPERLAADRKLVAQQRRDIYRRGLPRWVASFVRDGVVPSLSDGRQRACFDCAHALRERGWEREEVRDLLHGGRFDRSDFEDHEIDHAVENAFKD